MIWYDMIWYGMIWYDMVWYDMIWYHMIWYDMMWYHNITEYEHIESLKRIGSRIQHLLHSCHSTYLWPSWVFLCKGLGRREFDNLKTNKFYKGGHVFIVRLYCFMFLPHYLKPPNGFKKKTWEKKHTFSKSCYPWVWLQKDLYHVPRPSEDVKFQAPGLFLVVKGLKFQTLGGFRYLIY